MKIEQTLDLNHIDNRKQREWNFYEYGVASKLMELLKKNFPHFLYKNDSDGFTDLEKGKSFVITLMNIKNKGDEIAIMIPSLYFESEGYSEISEYIENEFKKLN